MDATITSMYSQRMMYMSEVYSIYSALQRSAVPVRFVDEQSLAEPESLKDLRVIYVTAPDLPAESVVGSARTPTPHGAGRTSMRTDTVESP